MCTIVEENTLDSVQAHLGDTLATSRMKKGLHRLEIIHEDVQQILSEPSQSSVAEGTDDGALPGGNAVDSEDVKHGDSSEILHTSSGKNNAEIYEACKDQQESVIVVD